jgi:hypothetical protein
MRALVQLYHQSETFITPETLNQAIDEAFAPVNGDKLSAFGVEQGVRYSELKADVMQRRGLPRMVEWDETTEGPGMASIGKMWSEQTSERSTATMQALFGVEADASGKTVPGWDVLKESVEVVEAEQKLKASRASLFLPLLV